MGSLLARRVETKPNPAARLIITAGFISLVAYLLTMLVPDVPLPYRDQMTEAARIMTLAQSAVQKHCLQEGIPIDAEIDPNRTGLIGPEIDRLTTTIGHPAAKRTTTNPEFAALLVHLMYQSGVAPGDRVAIGSSGSFPALMIAALAAAEAMSVTPVSILSLGASGYGATRPEFHLLKISELLLREGIIGTRPVAASLGGDRDRGREYPQELRESLLEEIREAGMTLLEESSLRRNVEARMAVYGAGSTPISAYINAGGSYANLGTSNLALKLKPGLNRAVDLPPEDERGVLFEMAAQGIPTIHLLFIEGLARQYNLPWDPRPLPAPGEWSPPITANRRSPWFWTIAALHFALLLILGVRH
jgi:poly-gamma-glutamate system protein